MQKNGTIKRQKEKLGKKNIYILWAVKVSNDKVIECSGSGIIVFGKKHRIKSIDVVSPI